MKIQIGIKYDYFVNQKNIEHAALHSNLIKFQKLFYCNIFCRDVFFHAFRLGVNANVQKNHNLISVLVTIYIIFQS